MVSGLAAALAVLLGCGTGARPAVTPAKATDSMPHEPGVVITLARHAADEAENLAAMVEERRVIDVPAGESTIAIPGLAATAKDVHVYSQSMDGTAMDWLWWRIEPGSPASETILRARVKARAAGRHAVRILYKAPGLSWAIAYRIDLDNEDKDEGGDGNEPDSEAHDSGLRLKLRSHLRIATTSQWRMTGAQLRLLDASAWGTEGVVWRGQRDSATEPWPYHAGEAWLPARREYVIRAQASARVNAAEWGQEAGALGIDAGEPRQVLVVDARRSRQRRETNRLDRVPAGPGLAHVRGQAGREHRSIAVHVKPGFEQGRLMQGRFVIDLGGSHDIQAQRRQRFIKRRGNTLREQYELFVTNTTGRPALVRVIEPLVRMGRVEVIATEPAPAHTSATELCFVLRIAPGQREKIRYEVEYRR